MAKPSLPKEAKETIRQDRAMWQHPQSTLHRGSPAVVETRLRMVDWKADPVIGKNHRQAIVCIVERESGMTLIQEVERKTVQVVSDAVVRLLKPYRNKVHTITADNGREFAKHENIAKTWKADFYFAHPYASWKARHERLIWQ